MQNIHIKDIQIKLPIQNLLQTIQEAKEIAIDINGNVYTSNIDEKAILIFRRNLVNVTDESDPIKKLTAIFTEEYKPVFDNEYCTIKPLIAWQEVIQINTNRMLYLDHPTDGIDIFTDEMIEELCFEAISLDITYRDIADFIEKNCEGTFVYYENDIQFSGFAVIEDIQITREKIKEYLKNTIQDKINEGLLDPQNLDYEQQEAYEFIFQN